MANSKSAIITETEEERKERIRMHNTTRTKVVPDKRKYDRKKQKQADKKVAEES